MVSSWTLPQFVLLSLSIACRERVIGTELSATRYEKAAEAFDVHAEFVENAEQISPAVERAFASGRPACINVMTDPSVISPAVQAGGLG